MGTFIMVIASLSQIALANPRQHIEVRSPTPSKKTPIFVECRWDGVRIYPDDPDAGEPDFVDRDELDQVDNAWHELLVRLRHDDTKYVFLLIRDDGVGSYEDARASLRGLPIDVGYDALFGDEDVRFRERSAP